MYLEFQLSGLGSAPFQQTPRRPSLLLPVKQSLSLGTHSTISVLLLPELSQFASLDATSFFPDIFQKHDKHSSHTWFFTRDYADIIPYWDSTVISWPQRGVDNSECSAANRLGGRAEGKTNGHIYNFCSFDCSSAKLTPWTRGDRSYRCKYGIQRTQKVPPVRIQTTLSRFCGGDRAPSQFPPAILSASRSPSWTPCLLFLRKRQGHCRLALCFSRSSEVSDPGEMTQDVRKELRLLP